MLIEESTYDPSSPRKTTDLLFFEFISKLSILYDTLILEFGPTLNPSEGLKKIELEVYVDSDGSAFFTPIFTPADTFRFKKAGSVKPKFNV